MRRKLLSTIFVCAFVFCANAQSFTKYSVGIDGGTYGYGIWGATNLHKNFVLKAGFNYFGLNTSLNAEIPIDGYVIGTDQKVKGMNAIFGQPRIQMPHGKVIAEWYPAADGIFSLAFGTYIGVFDVIADGLVENYQNAVTEHGGDIEFRMLGAHLRPRADGSFDGRIRIGENFVKPYVGIGLGRSIPKNHIGFKFDLGLTYQGNVKFISEQANIDDVRDSVGSQDYADLGIINTFLYLAKFWPVLNFSLSYKF